MTNVEYDNEPELFPNYWSIKQLLISQNLKENLTNI